MPRLQLDAVEQTYRGTPPVQALRGVSLTVEQGDFVAIEGSSGGGKSSLLNIVGLLDAPVHGAYRIDDVEPARQSARELAELRSSVFAFIFQSFHLLDRRPVIDSVELALLYRAVPRAQRHVAAEEALARVGLAHLINQRSNKLSGGERQRVAIARALASRAPVIVADEPTGNLDSVNGRAIVESLHDLNRGGSTIVLVTHDPDVAATAGRRIHLRDGQVVNPGATSEPLRSAHRAADAPGGAAPNQLVPPGHASRVRARDVVRDAFASVWSRKGRTAGLVMAVAVGVALAVATLGLSTSAKSQVAETFDAHENREVTVTSSAPEVGAATVTPVVPADRATTIQALDGLSGVSAASIVADYDQHALQASSSRPSELVTVHGVTGDVAAAASMDVDWAPGSDHGLSAGEMLIGRSLAERLDIGPLVGGPVMLLDGRSVAVVGIVNSSGRLPETLGTILVSNEDEPFLGASNRERVLLVTVPGAALQVAAQAPLVIDPAGPERLEVSAPGDPRDLRTEVEDEVRATLLILTGVALLASILSLANAMVLSILERRQEFGLRRAIGARPVHIVSLVLTESSVVGVIGGICGLFLGMAAILAVTIVNGWSPVFDPRVAPIAILGGVIVGGLGGVVAAARASRIRPSDALRQ